MGAVLTNVPRPHEEDPLTAAATGELAAMLEARLRGEASEPEIDAYAALLPLAPALVLDGMAGVGRLLEPLRARGWRIHGAEGAPARFALLEARLRSTDDDASLFRQDLASLNLPFRYAGAYVAAPELQTLAGPKLAAGLARVRAHLVPPGIVVLGFVLPAIADHPPGAPAVEIERVQLSATASITVRTEIDVDVEARRIDRRERYERREARAVTAREDARRRITWYDETEAAALVSAAGFHGVRVVSLAVAPLPGRAFAVVATD